MTKKVPRIVLRIERNFFVNLIKNVFGRPHRAAAAADFFGPAARPRPPPKMTRAPPPPPQRRGTALPWTREGGVIKRGSLCGKQAIFWILTRLGRYRVKVRMGR